MLTVDLDRLGVGAGDRVLDAGCGGGRHCFGCYDRGARVIGVDLDRTALRIAQAGLYERRLRGRRGACGALLGDVFRLPFCDAAFDRVICSEVMEHVHDYPAAIRELVRVLRPGGRIAVTIPTATTELVYLHLTREYFESPGGHIRIFQPRELARALGRAGVRVEGASFAHALHSPYWALRCALGLHDETRAITLAYRRFLMRASVSPVWRAAERWLDRIWPKSVVLYGARMARGVP